MRKKGIFPCQSFVYRRMKPPCTISIPDAPPDIFGTLEPLKAVFNVWHPVTKICTRKKFQSNRTISSRDMAKYVGRKNHKKREKEERNLANGPNELKFRLILDFGHRIQHTKF